MREDLIRRSDALAEFAESTSAMPEKQGRRRIEEIPAVDAVEVRHGRWLPHPNKEYPDTEVCSSCGMGTITGKFIFHFCPWCGARMDGEEEHNAAN